VRITAPKPTDWVNYSQVDLADPRLYTGGDAHLVWQTLRAEEPVFWHEHSGAGFWVVTQRADARRVLRDYQDFTSEGGTAIAMLGCPDPAAGLMMQATDPPRHQRLREQIGQPLSPHAISRHAETVRSIVNRALAPASDGGVWDAATALSPVPMAVAASLMGLPDADVGPLMRMSFATLAPLDPLYRTGPEQQTLEAAHSGIMEFFAACLAERRRRPGSDLVSQLLAIEVDGRRLNRQELLVNCLSLVVGSVVTTSQVVSATIQALAGQHGGEGRWPTGVPVDSVVEEALRWSSPVTHFMRRARRAVELRGKNICAGDAVTAWIASGNRDESVFEQPYLFDAERRPNRHFAFGSGPHRCIGAPLARMMLRLMFQELFTRIESFELAGTPSHLVSNQIAGMTSLPIRVKPRLG
jgi:cytochrome P450